MSSDDEWEEEEVLVYMDFDSKVDDDIVSIEKEFKIIGIDSETPVLQLSNQVFQGKWKDALGTQVIFEEDENPPRSDALFTETPKMFLKYSAKTNKILRMSRIFVNPKDEPNSISVSDSKPSPEI